MSDEVKTLGEARRELIEAHKVAAETAFLYSTSLLDGYIDACNLDNAINEGKFLKAARENVPFWQETEESSHIHKDFLLDAKRPESIRSVVEMIGKAARDFASLGGDPIEGQILKHDYFWDNFCKRLDRAYGEAGIGLLEYELSGDARLIDDAKHFYFKQQLLEAYIEKRTKEKDGLEQEIVKRLDETGKIVRNGRTSPGVYSGSIPLEYAIPDCRFQHGKPVAPESEIRPVNQVSGIVSAGEIAPDGTSIELK